MTRLGDGQKAFMRLSTGGTWSRLARSHTLALPLAESLPLLLIALSGVAITFQPAIVKARLGVAADTPWPEQASAIAADVQRIDALAGGPAGWWPNRLPTAHLPLYEIWLADGDRAYYHSSAATFDDRFGPCDGFEIWPYDLHSHLVASEWGPTSLLPGKAEPIDVPHAEADGEETDWQLVLAGAEDVSKKTGWSSSSP